MRQQLGLAPATPVDAARYIDLSFAPLRGSWIGIPFGSVLALPTNPVPVIIGGACTIKEVIMTGLGSSGGSATVAFWKAALSAHFPPVITDDITGGVPPAIVAGVKYQNSVLAGWTPSLNQDDCLLLTLTSVALFTFLSVQVRVG